MEQFVLDEYESVTLIEMAQDAIDRGIICSHYEVNTIEDIISKITNEYGDIVKGKIKITVEIVEE